MTDFATLGIRVTSRGVTKADTELNRLSKTSKRAERNVGDFATKANTGFAALISKAGGLRGLVAIIGGFVAARGLTRFASEAVRVGAQFENVRATLQQVTGSAEAARMEFARLQEISMQSSVDNFILARQQATLLANDISLTTREWETLLEASENTIVPRRALENLAIFRQRLAQGSAHVRDLDRSLDAGLPVYTILREELGITRLELSKFSEQAGGTEKVWNALIKGFEKRYGGTAELRARTLGRIFNNLGDQFGFAQDAFATGFGDAGLKDVVLEMTELLEAVRPTAEAIGQLAGAILKISWDLFTVPVDVISSWWAWGAERQLRHRGGQRRRLRPPCGIRRRGACERQPHLPHASVRGRIRRRLHRHGPSLDCRQTAAGADRPATQCPPVGLRPRFQREQATLARPPADDDGGRGRRVADHRHAEAD